MLQSSSLCSCGSPHKKTDARIHPHIDCEKEKLLTCGKFKANICKSIEAELSVLTSSFGKEVTDFIIAVRQKGCCENGLMSVLFICWEVSEHR